MSELSSKIRIKVAKSAESISKIVNEKCDKAQGILEKAMAERNDALVSKAVELYEEVIETSPKSPRPYYGLARISYSLGKNEYAIRLLNQTLSLDPFFDPARSLLEKVKKEHKLGIGKDNSKISIKTLSQKLKKEQKNNQGIFSKLLEIIKTEIKLPSVPRKTGRKNDFGSLIQETQKKMSVNN